MHRKNAKSSSYAYGSPASLHWNLESRLGKACRMRWMTDMAIASEPINILHTNGTTLMDAMTENGLPRLARSRHSAARHKVVQERCV